MAKAPAEIRSLARSHTDAALQTLKAIMDDAEVNPSARVSAACYLLDRGWGKPKQALVGGDEDDAPIQTVTRVELVASDGNRKD